MKTKINQITCKKIKTSKKVKSLDQSLLELGIQKIKEYEEIIRYF
ncbi:MAG: hypothetical protein V4622_11135 [Bacteroidota bacterium]